jgi:hypothetical protein
MDGVEDEVLVGEIDGNDVGLAVGLLEGISKWDCWLVPQSV